MESLLKIKNLHVGFSQAGGVAEAIRGLDLEIFKGETLGLVGESGCGKSLTAFSIMRLLPAQAQILQGSLIYKGQDLLKLSEEEYQALRGKEISLVFQEPFTSLNPVLKVGTQIAETLMLHQGFSRTQAEREAVFMLAQVGIREAEMRAHQYPHQFSGGMRQRALIAIALACRPSLLIGDEPTTALDVTVQAQILELLKKLKSEMGLTLLLITHDLSVVASVADRVAVMYAGKIIEQGKASDIFEAPRHPYTRALLACIPRMGEGKRRLPSLEGQVPEITHMPEGCSFYLRCPQQFKRCHREEPALLNHGQESQVACHLFDKNQNAVRS